MSTTQASSAPQVTRIDFDHPSTNPDAAPIPCRLYFTAPPSHATTSATSPDANRTLEAATASPETNAHPNPDILLTHGAGSQLDNPALDAFAEGLASTHTVLCFADQGTVQHRISTFSTLLASFPSISAFGGRSIGSVAAVAASLVSPTKIHTLILFSLPLSYKGANEPGRDPGQLDRELLELGPHVEVLVVGGDRDELCQWEEMEGFGRRMGAGCWAVRIEGADHGIRFEEGKRRRVCGYVGGLAGRWVVGERSAFGKERNMLVRWDETQKECKTSVLEGVS